VALGNQSGDFYSLDNGNSELSGLWDGDCHLMATLLLESYDIYSGRTGGLPTALNGRWNCSGSTSSADEVGRYAGRSMGYFNTVTTKNDYIDLASSQQIVRCGFAMYVDALYDFGSLTSGQQFWDWRDSAGTLQCDLTLDAHGRFRVRRNGATTVAQSGTTKRVKSRRWHTIEIEIKIDNTTGYVLMYLDGVEIINATALDTQQTANANCARVAFKATTGLDTQHLVDDLWVTDGTSYGDCRFQQLVPTSDDTVALTKSTGSTNYGVVDEPQVNTSDYVSGTAAGDKDTYGITDLDSTLDTVKTAMLVAYANNITPAGTSRAFLVSGATTDNTPAITNTTTFSRIQEIFDLDPNTGAAWTVSNINACKVGVEVAT
jgi:hypothetical protein